MVASLSRTPGDKLSYRADGLDVLYDVSDALNEVNSAPAAPANGEEGGVDDMAPQQWQSEWSALR